MIPTDRPLGYWVKHLDNLLETSLDRVLARSGIRRRHWQVLNVLREGPRDRAQIAEAMLAFWLPASVTQTDVVDDLVRRGWAEIDGDLYALTSDGEEAHSRVSLDVATLRAQVTQGFSADEYAAVVNALARMAENLEGSEQGR
ncbi:MarR family winged helix-turn-helix transcriptional regulator [Sporichthya brevicatena]|uniref:MarR family winged helix-turn-helix transcriptional regulator n=1 Tax=Sporichthya brevicatena TaxID=171442 RepID=A0ABP3SKI9_9ACTN